MDLVTKNKTIRLVFTTRKLVNISNLLKGKNFEELYFKAVNDNDLCALSKIIYIFAENVADGTEAFKSSEDVYDFIDDYKEENKKSYDDIFKDIAGVINDEGFFKTKRTKKEIEEMIANPISGINMNDIIKTSAEKAATEVAQKQFQGYKG